MIQSRLGLCMGENRTAVCHKCFINHRHVNKQRKQILWVFVAGRFAGEQIPALNISLVLTDNTLLTSFS